MNEFETMTCRGDSEDEGVEMSKSKAGMVRSGSHRDGSAERPGSWTKDMAGWGRISRSLACCPEECRFSVLKSHQQINVYNVPSMC